jgi:hypothetical protein
MRHCDDIAAKECGHSLEIMRQGDGIWTIPTHSFWFSSSLKYRNHEARKPRPNDDDYD